MPARAYVLQRIVQAVAVAVKALGVSGIGYNCIRADEPAYQWIVVAGVIVVQPGGVKAFAIPEI